ncbi:MAG TPA: periplasmic heavy metal sensor [Tenuifilaceae bacterium]|nr:periplasmic heavy metal sensor [Tenuifilaceae bacterium]HPE18316.1 periplasmic heavy metal sensor [Tenuifilaceae bacterium]HPJ47102.1 periplasmic heavy metal sensor [Tenuifilaceae bacterium]HPQ33092.1 periplasmic heavy metal sensor [Tenuifilaceae bacterium]HRX68294.1 periplasmic heavy metal sensor [Tenuifilaceae bacterium]
MNDSRNRILVGIVVLLAAINVAILLTIGFNYARVKRDVRPDIRPETRDELQRTKFLSRELNLTPEQHAEFHSLRDEYVESISDIREQIRSTYQQTMMELANDEPNEDILDSLSNEIARLHKENHQITIDHFKRVKNVCSGDQQECLRRMFFRMMPMDENHNIRSQRMHAPHRFRGPRNRINSDTSNHN